MNLHARIATALLKTSLVFLGWFQLVYNFVPINQYPPGQIID
jgi:hypothetical protein